jgi:hypothetical protein
MTLYAENSLGGYGAFTAKVYTGETVTAGDFVKTVGTEITATSTVQDKLLVAPADANGDEALVVGIALEGGTAGDFISVATRGLFRLVANAGISAGAGICQMGSATNMYVTTAESGGRVLGIALTTCNAQADYVLAYINISGHVGAAA